MNNSLHIILYNPKIAYNTGNIIRLCANVGAELHLIKPLGFKLYDKKIKRAALDYSDLINIKTYSSFDEYVLNSPKEISLHVAQTEKKFILKQNILHLIQYFLAQKNREYLKTFELNSLKTT